MMTQLDVALAYLDRCQQEMLRLWETIVRLETPSAAPEAVDKLASHLDTYCNALGMETEKFRPEGAGTCLSAWTAERELSPVLLLGHMDTVHPAGSFPGSAWTEKDDGCVYGPGVHDCKGGLVIALYVIRALQYAGYDRRQLKLALASDEETAHTLSKRKVVDYLQKTASGCGAVFTFESGLIGGIGFLVACFGGGQLFMAKKEKQAERDFSKEGNEENKVCDETTQKEDNIQ